MRVVWTATALRAVRDAYAYLADLNPDAAAELAASLLAAGDSLESFPYRGRKVPDTAMRELVVVHPYALRYRIEGGVVEILRVRHASRRPTDP